MNRIAMGLVRRFSTGTIEVERTLARRIELMEKQLAEQGEDLAARIRWRTAFFVLTATGSATVVWDYVGNKENRVKDIVRRKFDAFDALRDQHDQRLADLDYRLGEIEKERQQTPLATEPEQAPDYGAIFYISMVSCAAAWAWFTK